MRYNVEQFTGGDIIETAMNGGVPVVHLIIGASDILIALQRAAASYNRVKLILHESIPFEPDDYKGLITVEVIRYEYRKVVELRHIVDRLGGV